MDVHTCDSNGEEFKKFREMMAPGQIDSSIRQALQMLWMIMPDDKKNIDAVEKEFRRLVDRAIRDMREDSEAFHGSDGS